MLSRAIITRRYFKAIPRFCVNSRTFAKELPTEDDIHVLKGPNPKEPLPKISLGKFLYDHIITSRDIHPALVDAATGQGLSYRQLLCDSCSLAEALVKKGICKNDFVSVSCENIPEFFIPVLATLFMGAVIVPLNPTYRAREIIYTLGLSKPRIMFTSRLICPKYLRIKSRLPYLEKIVVLDGKEIIPGAETLDDYINKEDLETIPEKFQLAEVNPDEQVGFIMYSSGTSGLPKGVMLTHTNIYVSIMHARDPRYWLMHTKGVTFGLIPFYHVYGLALVLSGLITNDEVPIIQYFDEHFFLCCVQKYKIPRLTLAPPLVFFLAKHPLIGEYELTCVKEIIIGAAPVSKHLEELLKTRLKVPSLRQIYGLTEAPLAVLFLEVGDERFGSCGKVMSYVLCKVRDPATGKSLGPNEPGELCFKGPMVMKGYINDEEANCEAFTCDGWLKTGDIGYYDEDNYFYIVDRMKEVILYKGFQVPPAELEALLMTYPKVRDVAVIGIPNEKAGELPLAFIVKYPNVPTTEEEIVKFVAENMSPAKKLRGGVLFVPTIPRTSSGKILRRTLKEMYKEIKYVRM